MFYSRKINEFAKWAIVFRTTVFIALQKKVLLLIG